MRLMRWDFHRLGLLPASLHTALSQTGPRTRNALYKLYGSHAHCLHILSSYRVSQSTYCLLHFGGPRNAFEDIQAHRGT